MLTDAKQLDFQRDEDVVTSEVARPPTGENQSVDVFLIADKLSCCCRLCCLFNGALV